MRNFSERVLKGQVLATVLVTLFGSCAARRKVVSIPGCQEAQVFVPTDCYALLEHGSELEVRCARKEFVNGHAVTKTWSVHYTCKKGETR